MHVLEHIIKNKSLMEETAIEYGTPLYIYSLDRIKENLLNLNSSIKDYFKNRHICYAVKANSNPHLIKHMKSTLPDLGADCSSPGEIYAAELAGINTKNCIYTGNYESESELSLALDKQCTINLDDINSFKKLVKIDIPEKISFRLNPGFGKGSFSHITTGGKNAKFGVPNEKIITAYRLSRDTGVKRFGIHSMTGSGVLDESYFPKLFDFLLQTTVKIEKELHIRIEFVSIGGGLGIPYKEGDKPLNIKNVFKKMADIYAIYFPSGDGPELWIEPGKFIVGDAGILLTKVTGLKESYKNFIGLDAGMETLMRPALYGAYHKIIPVDNSNSDSLRYDFTGKICENTDRLAVDRKFPAVNEGDLIAVMDVGAYGFSMSHNFNTRPRAAEISFNGTDISLIRRRETIEDIFNHTRV